MEGPRSRVSHRAKGKVRRDTLLHARSRRSHYRSWAKQTGLRLRLNSTWREGISSRFLVINSGERRNTMSESKSSASQVQVGQTTYQMPPKEGITIAHFIVVADIERSARFYEKVFGARVLSRGDSKGAPGYFQIANAWIIVNVGGGPTPDKPTVTLSVPPDPDHVSSFMNIRVADIQACYELWRSRGAEFITEPTPNYGATRCYIRDPDGYIIEVGQSNPGITYG